MLLSINHFIKALFWMVSSYMLLFFLIDCIIDYSDFFVSSVMYQKYKVQIFFPFVFSFCSWCVQVLCVCACYALFLYLSYTLSIHPLCLSVWLYSTKVASVDYQDSHQMASCCIDPMQKIQGRTENYYSSLLLPVLSKNYVILSLLRKPVRSSQTPEKSFPSHYYM